VLDALAERDDVVLVAHSLGGCVIPLVGARRPLRRAVFLCAIIPEPGRALGEVAAEQQQYAVSEFGPALASIDELGRLVPTDRL
jgi:hypothetical protein